MRSLQSRISAITLLPFMAGPAAAVAGSWNYLVTLDGKPIGTHEFVVTGPVDRARVHSEARYRVKVLGVPVYRYEHRSDEAWADGCLHSLSASTDDNGARVEVDGQALGGVFSWDVHAGGPSRPKSQSQSQSQSRPACTMSFAYWNPAIFDSASLLDPGTGKLVPVKVEPLPPSTIEVRGRPTPVQGRRIFGLDHPIDVWYAGRDWVGLDAPVSGGRLLQYRLP